MSKSTFGKESNFVDWFISYGINILNELTDFNFVVIGREERTRYGNYIDLTLYDQHSECKAVVEIMLSKLDHNHVGKIITYTCSVNADIGILIAENFSSEHINTFRTLNRDYNGQRTFYLIEIETNIQSYQSFQQLRTTNLKIIHSPKEDIDMPVEKYINKDGKVISGGAAMLHTIKLGGGWDAYHINYANKIGQAVSTAVAKDFLEAQAERSHLKSVN